MPFIIVKNDITKMKVDAIVNAANSSLLGGGGVDGAIHRAAGPGLLRECEGLGGCPTGMAKITGGYELDCKYIIHTVGPVYKNGKCGEAQALRSCYISSLRLAAEYECESVAFPLISAGAYGYPRAEAFELAGRTIEEFLLSSEREMTVYLVIYDKQGCGDGGEHFRRVREYIRGNRRQDEYDICLQPSCYSMPAPEGKKRKKSVFKGAADCQELSSQESVSGRLRRLISHADESFSQLLLRLIDEKGMTDVQCYKKANVDRKLFSKIRSDSSYKPSKTTAIALAMALEPDEEEFEEILRRAGYALSPANEFDIIIEYFVKNRIYDVFQINEILFAFDQSLLGSK